MNELIVVKCAHFYLVLSFMFFIRFVVVVLNLLLCLSYLLLSEINTTSYMRIYYLSFIIAIPFLRYLSFWTYLEHTQGIFIQ